jgi:N-acetylglucosamine kinase-like BadF-type ATPase
MDTEEDKRQTAALLAAEGFTPTILNDAEILLANGANAALIAGTGSICLGRSDSKTIAVGGHGPLFDEGGGRWLAREALEILAKISDGRLPSTPDNQAFHAELFKTLNISQFSDLYPEFYDKGDERRYTVFTLVTPTIFALAAASNTAAVSLIESTAAELAGHVLAIGRQLKLEDIRLNFTGSVMIKNPSLQDRVWQLVRAAGVTLKATGVEKPVEAALDLAFETQKPLLKP